MEPFHYRDGQLYCEDVPVTQLADTFGTPLYVYSQNAILDKLHRLQTAFAEVHPLICYSVKANSNLGILKVMAEHGSGFDVVSAGELYRVKLAGGAPGITVFAGVGKTDDEIRQGLEAGVLMFNVESEAELEAVARVAASLGKVAPIAFRVNPDVDPKTHRYISTGQERVEVRHGYRACWTNGRGYRHDSFRPNDRNTHAHRFADHIHRALCRCRRQGSRSDRPVAQTRPSHRVVQHGRGIRNQLSAREAKPVEEFARAILPGVKAANCRLAIEPGRVIVGNAGILVSRVLYTKQSGEKRFLIQDAAMNDLIRPALYESFHRIWPVAAPAGAPMPDDSDTAMVGTEPWDVVGPVCESGDFLAKDRPLPRVGRGRLVAIFSAGAYGMVMASNYNTRPRAAEVLVDRSWPRLVRRRETYEDLVRQEVEL